MAEDDIHDGRSEDQRCSQRIEEDGAAPQLRLLAFGQLDLTDIFRLNASILELLVTQALNHLLLNDLAAGRPR